MRKIISFQVASSRKSSALHNHCFRCSESKNTSGTAWIIQNQLSIKRIIIRHISPRYNSLNVAYALGASHSTYVFNALLWTPGSPSLQVLWTIPAGMQGCAMKSYNYLLGLAGQSIGPPIQDSILWATTALFIIVQINQIDFLLEH